MPPRPLVHPLAVLAYTLTSALAGCSSTPSAPPRALLDERSGVTINAVAQPIVLARVRNDTGGFGHDCVTLVAAEKDEAGKYTELLLLYRWSFSYNSDARLPPPPPNTGRLVIHADEHTIELQPLPQVPVNASQSKDLFLPTSGQYVAYAYRTDFAVMQLIASSHELSVHLPQETPDVAFSLWRDGRPALTQLLSQLNGS